MLQSLFSIYLNDSNRLIYLWNMERNLNESFEPIQTNLKWLKRVFLGRSGDDIHFDLPLC